MRYQAYLFYAARLPAWIKFDSLNHRFEFYPPHIASGSFQIRVVARDFDDDIFRVTSAELYLIALNPTAPDQGISVRTGSQIPAFWPGP